MVFGIRLDLAGKLDQPANQWDPIAKSRIAKQSQAEGATPIAIGSDRRLLYLWTCQHADRSNHHESLPASVIPCCIRVLDLNSRTPSSGRPHLEKPAMKMRLLAVDYSKF